MSQFLRSLVVSAAFAAIVVPIQASGQTAHVVQLRGDLSQVDADMVIAKAKDAQDKLRKGDRVFFELLSGAPAYYDETKIAPRDTFLALSFDAPFSITKLPGDRLWQPYRLEITSENSSLVWQVDVVLGSNNSLERVEILTRASNPF